MTKKIRRKAKRVSKRKPVDAAEAQLQAEVAEVRASVAEPELVYEGDECPNCHNGTIGGEEGRYVCRGECGALFGAAVLPRSDKPSEPAADAAPAAVDFETDLRAIAKAGGPAAEAFAERLLAATPPLAPPPVLPADLSAHAPDFSTPPGRAGQMCEGAYAVLPDMVVWRITDKLAGDVTYMLSAWDDLCHDEEFEPALIEPRSRAWYPVTDEQHAALAAWEGNVP